MLGRRDRFQDELFVSGSLRDLIPDDHVLVRVDSVLDLSWLRDDVADCYNLSRGRPGIDPEAALRLMLAGLLLGIVEDRRLLREAQVNLAIRWFAGWRLHERLPDHSSLTRIRQRWGPARFRSVFERTVLQCVSAGLVKGDLLHLDATLIRADVSWESLVQVHLDAVAAANEEDRPDGDRGDGDGGTGVRAKAGKTKKISRTDPDARMATSHRNHRLEPVYKQLTAVDGAVGVVLDAEVVSAERHEGGAALEQLDRVAARTGLAVATVTGDKAYAYGRNYAALEARGIRAVIPPQRPARARMPLSRFKYDAFNDLARCPRGRILRPAARYAGGRFYRARRRHRRKLAEDRAAARSHRARVEGVHGEAKARHGLARAARRGLANVAIQAWLTAAAINLKRLARALLHVLWGLERQAQALFAAMCASLGVSGHRMRQTA